MSIKTIAIAGGSGMVGSRIVQHLRKKGYQTWVLTRSGNEQGHLHWDPEKSALPSELKTADAIINLAGASVFEHRWSKAYKKKILESRILSTRTLVDFAKQGDHTLKVFLNASATGYYGTDRKEQLNEGSAPGEDFLARVCIQWEKETERLKDSAVRLLIYRFGIVLSSEQGALPELRAPVKKHMGAILGSGTQIFSWIHIDDLCRMLIHGLENPAMQGVYNAVAPEEISHRELMEEIAARLDRSLLPLKVPGFLLRLILGEFANSILGSNPVSCSKVLQEGFWFQFPRLKEALKDLL